jgi:hypothetical protein
MFHVKHPDFSKGVLPMPVYHAPLLRIDPKETRRYAGLMKAKDFDEQRILDACEDALLLAQPRGVWELYDYDCETQTVQSAPPFTIEGKKIGAHLAGCDKVILLAATVGDDIEDMVTQRFEQGAYASSVLLDAAATTAVEQIADGMEKAIAPKMAAQGYGMRWRFSPGYGDWPLDPHLARGEHRRAPLLLAHARAAQERHGHHRPLQNPGGRGGAAFAAGLRRLQ